MLILIKKLLVRFSKRKQNINQNCIINVENKSDEYVDDIDRQTSQNNIEDINSESIINMMTEKTNLSVLANNERNDIALKSGLNSEKIEEFIRQAFVHQQMCVINFNNKEVHDLIIDSYDDNNVYCVKFQNSKKHIIKISEIVSLKNGLKLENCFDVNLFKKKIETEKAKQFVVIEYWDKSIKTRELFGPKFVEVDDAYLTLLINGKTKKILLGRIRFAEFEGEKLKKVLGLARKGESLYYDYANCADEILSLPKNQITKEKIAQLEALLWADIKYSKSSKNTKANSYKELGCIYLNQKNYIRAREMLVNAKEMNERIPVKRLIQQAESKI